MKLLFDENLSWKLPQILAREYPDSAHVGSVGLRGATDQRVWDFAQRNGFVIVSKDSDFRERSLAESHPPKVVCLEVGNARTGLIADLLRRQRVSMESFAARPDLSLLVLSLGRS